MNVESVVEAEGDIVTGDDGTTGASVSNVCPFLTGADLVCF